MTSRAKVYCETGGAIRLLVRATPNASKDEITGVWRGPDDEARLIVRVTAPPDKGRANKAVLKLLAKTLGLPKSAVSLTGGDKDRMKTVAIVGDARELVARLDAMLGALDAGEHS